MKIFKLSKRAELQFECHLDTKNGGLSCSFLPLPTIGIKRFGKVIGDREILLNGDTSIHLMWLFFEITLVIDDKIQEE